jgi:hypothetical protein
VIERGFDDELEYLEYGVVAVWDESERIKNGFDILLIIKHGMDE